MDVRLRVVVVLLDWIVCGLFINSVGILIL